MARWNPVPIAGGAYSDDTRPWSAQDTVNWIPEVAERPQGRSDSLLRCAPGLVTFCASMEEGPVRGLHDAEGLLLAVTGRTLYRIGLDGGAHAVGTIPGIGRVVMAHNQTATGHEVAIANGLSGYVYNTVTGALEQITDPGFPGFRVVDFIDGYLAGVEPAGRFWFHSELRQASQYNTLDRQDAEAAPDRVVTLISSHREVMVMGERTGQFFRNTGSATGTFANANGTEMEVGCASPYAIARLDNTVYWLGNDGIVYRLEGNLPRRVSLGPIEQAISRCDLRHAFAFTYEDRGHKIFYLTLPDGHTWGYDVWTNEWHRRESKGMSRWRLSGLVKSNGRWIGADYSNGRLYILDWNVQSEAGVEMERRRVTGVLHDNQNKLQLNGLELVFDTGRAGATSIPGFNPGLEIVGNLPDGFLGQPVDFQYEIVDALNDHGGVVLATGVLPAGCTVDATGRVAGTRSAIGSASWRLTLAGSLGRSARLDDTSETTNPATWLVSEFGYKRIGTFTANDWVALTDVNCQGYAYYVGGEFHLSSQSNVYAISGDRGATWTTSNPNVSAGGGRVAASGIYQLLCGGVTPVKRRTTGAWVELPDSPRANAIVAIDGTFVVTSVYSPTSFSSSNAGTSWTVGGTFTTGSLIDSPCMAANATRIVVVLTEYSAPTYTLRARYSDNAGASWSSPVTLAASSDTDTLPTDVVWDGKRFIAAIRTGAVYHSLDGVTWDLSESTIGVAMQMAAGDGAVLAACEDGSVYWTIDHGATWSARSYPSAGAPLTGIAWIYP